MPFIAFTFPRNGAEILWPFAILGWWLKSRFPPDESPRLAPKPLLLGIASALFLLIGSWVVAQNAMGGVFANGNFRADWSSTEELCLGLHPKDIALSGHNTVIRAMSEYNQLRPESGQALIEAHLQAHPRCIRASKRSASPWDSPQDPVSLCTVSKEEVLVSER